VANKGLRHYTGDETSNILLGQTGFKIVTSSAPVDVDDIDDVGQFPVIKVLVDGTMTAVTLRGDHFTLDGTINGGAITVAAGESYYGPFKEIAPAGLCVVAAYLG